MPFITKIKNIFWVVALSPIKSKRYGPNVRQRGPISKRLRFWNSEGKEAAADRASMAALAKPRGGAADRALLRLLLPSSSFSTKARRWSHPPKPQPPPPPKEAPPRPPEMPWTEELANSVRLTGSLKMPVQLETTADGRPWAVSLLMQEKSDSSPQFWWGRYSCGSVVWFLVHIGIVIIMWLWLWSLFFFAFVNRVFGWMTTKAVK